MRGSRQHPSGRRDRGQGLGDSRDWKLDFAPTPNTTGAPPAVAAPMTAASATVSVSAAPATASLSSVPASGSNFNMSSKPTPSVFTSSASTSTSSSKSVMSQSVMSSSSSFSQPLSVVSAATATSSSSSSSWGTPWDESKINRQTESPYRPFSSSSRGPPSLMIHRIDGSTISCITDEASTLMPPPRDVIMSNINTTNDNSFFNYNSSHIPSDNLQSVAPISQQANIPPPPGYAMPQSAQQPAFWPPPSPPPEQQPSLPPTPYNCMSSQPTQQPQPIIKPFFPHKTMEVPKSALYALYGKEPRRKPLQTTDYYTWHDAGPPHALQWTAAFVCPVTAEVFYTKPYAAAPDPHVIARGCVWYKKKMSAEHGAAANAHDCWSFRDLRQLHPQMPPFSILLAQGHLPYSAPLDTFPPAVPDSIRTAIHERRMEILQTHQAAMQVERSPEARKYASPQVEWAWGKRPEDDSAFPTYDPRKP